MRSEASVPATSRYLCLAARLSREAFAIEKHSAIDWCTKNATRLSASNQAALESLTAFELTDNTAAVILFGCYADIPSHRVFSAVFEINNPLLGAEIEAHLLFGIFWRRLPIESLEDGHHQIAVFEFPLGLPPLISSLPVHNFGQILPSGSVGLCDREDWYLIRDPAKDA